MPMTTTHTDDDSDCLVQTDEPEIRERQRRIARRFVRAFPEVAFDLFLEPGFAPMFRVFQRKMGRDLDDRERRRLLDRLCDLGGDRIGDVALDFDGPGLAAWLADREAE